MLVFKCSKCKTIYRKNEVSKDEVCSSCGSFLKVVNLKDDTIQENIKKNEDLSNGTRLNVGRIRTVSSQLGEEEPNKAFKKKDSVNKFQLFYEKKERYEKNNYSSTSSVYVESNSYIEGTIISAVNDMGFRRLPWEKLYDRFFYAQNVSNNQNSIYVRCIDRNGNVSNKTIVKYGQIRGGIGMFHTGMKIKAEGKINRRNEFVARTLMLEDNISVNTRTELSDIIYYASPLLVILFCILIFNFTGLIKGIVSSGYLKWYIASLIGTFLVSFCLIGRVVRVPIVNKIQTCTWVSVVLGTIIFFICKSIFAT